MIVYLEDKERIMQTMHEPDSASIGRVPWNKGKVIEPKRPFDLCQV